MITFRAEVVECKVRKTASMDKEISIRIETDDVKALELQQFINERAITIEIK